MTTKDQAIARLPTGPWSKEAEMIESWAANKPAPDCRTCEHKYESENAKRPYCLQSFSGVHCTNGDQYQSAPKMVLWRTA